MSTFGFELEDLIEDAGPEVPRSRILAIHEDADGRLWTAGLTGQAMREPDGRWVPIGSERGGFTGVGKFARGPDGLGGDRSTTCSRRIAFST